MKRSTEFSGILCEALHSLVTAVGGCPPLEVKACAHSRKLLYSSGTSRMCAHSCEEAILRIPISLARKRSTHARPSPPMASAIAPALHHIYCDYTAGLLVTGAASCYASLPWDRRPAPDNVSIRDFICRAWTASWMGANTVDTFLYLEERFN